MIPLLVAACGVPISAEEITATAVGGGGDAPDTAPLTAVMQASSVRVGQPAAELGVSAPIAFTPVTTGSAPLVTPSATRPAGTPTPTVTGTPPTATGTPSSSALTLDAKGTPVPATTGTATITGTPATATPVPAVGVSSLGAGSSGADPGQLLKLVNAGRASLGLSQLAPNAILASAASNYARYMATANFFAHDGLDGSRPLGRVTAAGYGGNWRGETLAAGQTTAEEAFDVWWNRSPPHRAILVDPAATEVGIGYYFDPTGYYGYYWVLEVGTP